MSESGFHFLEVIVKFLMVLLGSCFVGILQLFATPAHAGDVIKCELSPALQIRFLGHRSLAEKISLGAYERRHSGRVADSFAYAFGFSVVDERGKVIGPQNEMFFHDDEPRCNLTLMVDDKIFYLAARTVYRFTDEEGKRGGDVLVISEDSGKTFSQNLFPTARHSQRDASEIEAHRQAVTDFGYHRGRIRYAEGVLSLELTDPLNYQLFLYFESHDLGRHWQRSEVSDTPRVYTKAEVEEWREFFANERYNKMRVKAESETCKGGYGSPCAKQLEEAWDQAIKPCVAQANWQTCVKNFVPPTVTK